MRKGLIVAGLLALSIAGCGSSKSSSTAEGSTPSSTTAPASAGHTSEWTEADTKQAEGDLTKESQGEGLSAAFKQCLVKGVEETFSPTEYKKDSTEDKEANKAKGVAEACAKKYPPTGKE